MPENPSPFVDLRKIDHGAMFWGSKGCLVTNFGSRMIIPVGDQADMTYYKPRGRDRVLPYDGDFPRQWLDACGDPSRKTACDFEYSGT